MKSGTSIDSKAVEISPSKGKLCYSKSPCVPLSLTPSLFISKYTKCVIRQTKCTQFYLDLSCTSRALELNLLIYFRKTQNPSSTCGHQYVFYFNLIYLIMAYFTFICSITYLVNFINSIFESLNYSSYVYRLITQFLPKLQ